jgi:hypothetical protein
MTNSINVAHVSRRVGTATSRPRHEGMPSKTSNIVKNDEIRGFLYYDTMGALLRFTLDDQSTVVFNTADVLCMTTRIEEQ